MQSESPHALSEVGLGHNRHSRQAPMKWAPRGFLSAPSASPLASGAAGTSSGIFMGQLIMAAVALTL